MGQDREGKMKGLRQLAKADERYREIEGGYRLLEHAFSEITTRLTDEQQDIVWAFVCTSDELDHRLLEIACDYIDFDRPV